MRGSLVVFVLEILISFILASCAESFASSRPWGRVIVTTSNHDGKVTRSQVGEVSGGQFHRSSAASTILGSSRRRAGDDDDDDEDGERYEYARVGRRNGRGYRQEEGRGDYDDDSYDSGPSRRGDYRDDEYDGYIDDGYEDEYEEEEEDEEFEEGILVPNPILDAIDPEGAAERIPELFADPKWWRDAAAIGAVVLCVYLYTFDASDLVPWDSVTPDDFDLMDMYVK